MKITESQKTNILLEDIDGKIDLILDHVIEHDKRFDAIDKRFDGVEKRLERVEVILVGKADNARVDALERRVSVLEHI